MTEADTVQASSGGAIVSNTANVYWLQPSNPISTTAVFGQFFFSDVQSGNGPFTFDTLTPNTVSSLPAGQSLTFTALVIDEAGLPVPDTSVALSVGGANLVQLTGVTDATGQVSFTYTGPKWEQTRCRRWRRSAGAWASRTR